MSSAPRMHDQINGLRPSPLKINKASQTINKSSQQRKHPVIIYTHSPKIIHTQARDFMALVQRLTGLSRADRDHNTTPSQKTANTSNNSIDHVKKESSASESTVSESTNNNNSTATTSFLTDFPLFTPNSSSNDFFCSPKGNGNSIPSPSFFEFMKGFPGY